LEIRIHICGAAPEFDLSSSRFLAVLAGLLKTSQEELKSKVVEGESSAA
jgi:hypothetical protein